MATGGGNLNIFGDGGYDASSSLTFGVIESEEAEKLLFFFNKELNEEAEGFHLDLEIYKTMPRIEVRSRSSERKTAQECVKRWTDRLERELWKTSISGEDDGTLDQVKKVIRKCNQQVYVLPVQSKSKSSVVWIYSRNKTDLDHVVEAYSSTEPMVEMAPAKRQRASTPRNSQNMNAGSYRYVDSTCKFEFTTNENLHVRLYKRGINSLKVDAIVNAANNELANVGGVAEIISKAAGNDMERECKARIRQDGIVRDGSNVVTTAGKLPYNGVIHAVGPRWYKYRDKAKCLGVLMDTVINILKRAESCEFKTVAMPPISSGIFAVPKHMCAAMYLKGIIKFSKEEKLGSLQEFHIIDINDDVLDMVKEWYDRYTRDKRCLDLDEVVKSASAPAHHGQGNRHSTGYNRSQDLNRSRTGSPTGSRGDIKGSKDFRNQHYPNYHTHSTTNQSTKSVIIPFSSKTDVHIYSHDILKLKGIDAVSVSEDPYVQGSGFLSTALLQAGDEKYRKAHKNIQPRLIWNSTGEVLVTIAGDNLPFRHVLHAVIRRQNCSNEDHFQKQLFKAFTNILNRANVLAKKGTTGFKVAIPLIGVGAQKDSINIQRCGWTAVSAITKYLQTTKDVRISQIHLVNKDDQVTKILKDLFSPKTVARPLPPTPKPDFKKPAYKKHYEMHKNSTRIQTWKMDSGESKKTDVSRYMESYKITKPKTGNLIILGDDEEDDNGNCVICLSELEDPVQLKDCKHLFCRECIMEMFKTKTSCPICGTVYGIINGDQPRDGEANVYEEDESLPGFEKKKTYVIVYEFPDGCQEEFHPEEGKPYEGMKRRAFLPKTQEGTEVLGLLKQAFQQGLTFTIGSSRTTGKEGVITWNDIHHKTSRTGGPQKFGYPDPEYLSRVKEELACKGVTYEM